MPDKIKILIPLYNDWESLYLLIEKIKTCVPESLWQRFSFIIVDDCSLIPLQPFKFSPQLDLEVLQLNRNMGHQKAIAIGLAYLNTQQNFEKVVVMDADGEDRPEDLTAMLHASDQYTGRIIFARRLKRTEGFTFRFFYQIYKSLFKLLTGKQIAFGNFCVIPEPVLEKLVYVSEIWNHFSGGIIRSKLPYIDLPFDRGKRLAGKSNMNFTSLILHGLGAVSVHLDVVAVRLLLFCIGLIGVTSVSIITLFLLHFFTDFFISNLIVGISLTLIIILVQAFMVCLFLVFMVLTYRTHIHFIPAIGFQDFVLNIWHNAADASQNQ